MAKKKTERTKLTERADREMSRWVRLEQSDENGTCQCVICGCLKYWYADGMQMGHFINKGKGASGVRWLLHNVETECGTCNCSHGMRSSHNEQVAPVLFTLHMQKKYGQDIVDDLIYRKFQTIKYTEDEIREIGDLYKEFADKLLKEKGL